MVVGDRIAQPKQGRWAVPISSLSSATTFSMTTLSIMTLSIMTLSIKTLGITTNKG